MLAAHVSSPSTGIGTGGSGGGARMGDCLFNGWGVIPSLGFQTQGGMLTKCGAGVGSDTGKCHRSSHKRRTRRIRVTGRGAVLATGSERKNHTRGDHGMAPIVHLRSHVRTGIRQEAADTTTAVATAAGMGITVATTAAVTETTTATAPVTALDDGIAIRARASEGATAA